MRFEFQIGSNLSQIARPGYLDILIVKFTIHYSIEFEIALIVRRFQVGLGMGAIRHLGRSNRRRYFYYRTHYAIPLHFVHPAVRQSSEERWIRGTLRIRTLDQPSRIRISFVFVTQADC